MTLPNLLKKNFIKRYHDPTLYGFKKKAPQKYPYSMVVLKMVLLVVC